MVFYIAYRVVREHKDRRLVSKRLKALGCKRIHSSFWEANERRINDVLEAVGDNQPILLRRSREIRRAVYEGGRVVDPGSLIVVIYNASRDESGIKGLLAKTPYLKICRSVYAFPHNGNWFGGKECQDNIDQLLRLIKEKKRDAKIYSRMLIANSAYAVNVLIERARLRVVRKVERIIDGYRNLMQELLKNNVERRHVIDEGRKLYGEFTSLRRIALFYERWLGEDFTRDVRRLYPLMKKLHSIKNYC